MTPLVRWRLSHKPAISASLTRSVSSCSRSRAQPGRGSLLKIGSPITVQSTMCDHSHRGDGAADATLLELATFPARDRDEEQRELLVLPDPCPLRGVVAVRACAGLPRSEAFLLGAETEDEEHEGQHILRSRPAAWSAPRWCPEASTTQVRKQSLRQVAQGYRSTGPR